MTAIVAFIGWHDSGKTTLATKVVSELVSLGYRVAVIKSSNERGIEFDRVGTDTYKHRDAGASGVMMVAPDQVVLQSGTSDLSLNTLAHRYFPDADIVIAEGFKNARKIAKIEVVQSEKQQLRREVSRVIAVATDLNTIFCDYLFRLDQAKEIALFIEKRFLLQSGVRETTTLLVNGNKVPIRDFIQESLAGTVAGFVKTLKLTKEIKEIELRIKLDE